MVYPAAGKRVRRSVPRAQGTLLLTLLAQLVPQLRENPSTLLAGWENPRCFPPQPALFCSHQEKANCYYSDRNAYKVIRDSRSGLRLPSLDCLPADSDGEFYGSKRLKKFKCPKTGRSGPGSDGGLSPPLPELPSGMDAIFLRPGERRQQDCECPAASIGPRSQALRWISRPPRFPSRLL